MADTAPSPLPRSSAPPQPRDPRLDFSGVPRHWLAQDRFATHMINAVNLLFPAGERFFVRSVHRFAAQLGDPALRERVRGFERQEGHHARAHEAWFGALERQGFRVDRFLSRYQQVCYGVLERIAPASLSLAATAAAEHFTALLARGISRGVLDQAHPELRRLLLWHAAEELEHKSVAFDVLQAVRPSWALRCAGMLAAAGLLAGLWTWATLLLLWQDRQLGPPQDAPAGPVRAGERPDPLHVLRHVFVRGVADYLRPGFHPDQTDDEQLFHTFLAEAGLA